jgi:hypothetical protein
MTFTLIRSHINNYRSGFTTLPLTLLRASRCGSCVWGARVHACSGKMNAGDLRGSDRRSVIPYVHGRRLYCYVCGAVQGWVEPFQYWGLPDPFIAQGRVVTMKLRARQVAPGWSEPYTIWHQWLEIANDVSCLVAQPRHTRTTAWHRPVGSPYTVAVSCVWSIGPAQHCSHMSARLADPRWLWC